MAFQRIKHINRVINEIFFFKKLIKRYGNCLMPGRYRLLPGMRAVVADNPASMENAKPYFYKKIAKGKTETLAAKLNKMGYYRNRGRQSSGTYEAIYVANNYDKMREIKLFSFERKEILTVCINEDVCKKQLAEYDSLHRWFAMPNVQMDNQFPNAHKIAMVSLLPRPADDEAVKTIAQCICAYADENTGLHTKIAVEQLIAFDCGKEMNALLADLASGISLRMRTQEIPFCLQHGDLSRDNLIYGVCDGTENFWWIDWEHAGERVFFYDYFFYMLNTAIYFSDTTALDAYLSGEYDACMKSLFLQFGVDYDIECRKSYLLIFVMVFLEERVCWTGNINVLKMYRDFICKTVLDKE